MIDAAREASARLSDLLRREHSALAEFLVALAAFDRDRGWDELGHTSLFWFLHRELGLSKSAAFYRKTAAELVQRRSAMPLQRGRAREGHHPGEPGRGPATVLHPLEGRGEGDRRRTSPCGRASAPGC